jgi:Lrp/AsnC family transcriptional regulator, leucine-responsive regulatory protein
MDDIDRTIVTRLRKDARTSFRDLAAAVDLSPNAVADRVRRLVEQGTIRAFRAEIDPVALGRGLFAYVDLRMKPGITAAAFERRLRGVHGIVSATLTTGRFDYTLRVACADQDELVDVIETLRAKCGAEETYSRIILRETTYE